MSSGFIILLLLFVVLSSHGTNYYRRLKAYKKNKINGEIDMNELIKNYIDKECLICQSPVFRNRPQTRKEPWNIS